MNEQTEEQMLADVEKQAESLRATIAQRNAVARPMALEVVLAEIKKHKFTLAELAPSLRKRAFAPRPRKAKLASVKAA
jgi:hypothetical protein